MENVKTPVDHSKRSCSNERVRTEIQTEHALLRTIAGASRPLEEDMKLSPLQAIDRLHKLSEKFRDQWISPSPWLVLEDCWTLPASMPVPKMLEDIATHGQPIGMVGIAWLKNSKRYGVLCMYHRNRKDKKSRATIDRSAQAAEQYLVESIKQFNVQRETEGK